MLRKLGKRMSRHMFLWVPEPYPYYILWFGACSPCLTGLSEGWSGSWSRDKDELIFTGWMGVGHSFPWLRHVVFIAEFCLSPWTCLGLPLAQCHTPDLCCEVWPQGGRRGRHCSSSRKTVLWEGLQTYCRLSCLQPPKPLPGLCYINNSS